MSGWVWGGWMGGEASRGRGVMGGGGGSCCVRRSVGALAMRPSTLPFPSSMRVVLPSACVVSLVPFLLNSTPAVPCPSPRCHLHPGVKRGDIWCVLAAACCGLCCTSVLALLELAATPICVLPRCTHVMS